MTEQRPTERDYEAWANAIEHDGFELGAPVELAPVEVDAFDADLEVASAELTDHDRRPHRPNLPAEVDLAEVDAVLVGRPSLNGAGGGESVQRQVRLPADLDAALTARSEAEHRARSVIMRDALTAYLRAS